MDPAIPPITSNPALWCCFFNRIPLPFVLLSNGSAGAIKRGIISRQSTCLPLYSSSIKLVHSITWAYWSESSAVERPACKINALFSPRLAIFMLVLFFLCENEKKTREKPFTSTVFSSFPLTLVTHFWWLQPSSLWPAYFCFTPYLHCIYKRESTSL